MRPEDRRREPRYPHALPITITLGKKELALTTLDVSLRGVLVGTDTPLPLRQLVKLALGIDGDPIVCHGMIVHIVPREDKDGRPPGVAIQFFGFDGAIRERWGRFIDGVRRRQGSTPSLASLPTLPPPSSPTSPQPSSPPPLPPSAVRTLPPPVVKPAPPANPVTADRRQWERKLVHCTVYLDSMDDLATLTTRDISRGGMFIATRTPFAVGTRLRIEIKHPDTHAFFLDAVVRRRIDQGETPGVGVEFIELGAEAQRSLEDLISDEIEDAEGRDAPPAFVAAYDPTLE